MANRRWWPLGMAVAALPAVLLAGCAGLPATAQPGWVVGGEPAAYPRAEYLHGSGAAPDLDAARDRARAELARTFRVEIEAETRQDERLDLGPGGARLETAVQRQVTTRTDRVLHGVEIAEVWHDPGAGRYHALAVLHRERAAAALREEIAGLDTATAAHLRQADEEDDALRGVEALGRAVAEQQARQALQQALRVLTGRGVTVRYDLHELRALQHERIGMIGFTVAAAGDRALEVAGWLEAALAEAGFRVDGEHAAYRLEGRLHLDDLGKRDGWYWFRGALTVTLRGPDGEARGERRWPVGASATDRATASRRAADEAAGLIRRALPVAVLEISGGV